jgi:hypothetical protein
MQYKESAFIAKEEKDGSISFSFILEDNGPGAVAAFGDQFSGNIKAEGYSNGQLKISGAVKRSAVQPAKPLAPVPAPVQTAAPVAAPADRQARAAAAKALLAKK